MLTFPTVVRSPILPGKTPTPLSILNGCTVKARAETDESSLPVDAVWLPADAVVSPMSAHPANADSAKTAAVPILNI
jgi:hypothetical protein